VIASLGNCSKDYFTVAIIGAQNTGKSTLLNELFKTDFSVLKGEAGKRTTRGVVLSRDYQDSLIIMDVEGNDSYETHLEGDSVSHTFTLELRENGIKFRPYWRQYSFG
jgi:GTPase Era involved in 16S rRNA processing